MSNKLDKMEKMTPEERKAYQKAYQKEWYKQNREKLLSKQNEYYHTKGSEVGYKKYKTFYDKWHGLIEQLSAQVQAN